MTDIVKDVQYYLQEDPGVQALVVAPYIGKDDGFVNGWIFDSNLSVRQENTQRCAIVISYADGWDTAEDGSQAAFPSVIVDVWADPTREADNSVKVHDAKTKCFTIHEAVRKALHRTDASQVVYFDQTRIASSKLAGEPSLTWVTDGNGSRMLRARYDITIF